MFHASPTDTEMNVPAQHALQSPANTHITLKVLKLNEVATDLRSLRASGRMHQSILMCLLFAHMQTLAAPSVHVQVPSWQAFASSELVASRVPGGQIHTQSQTVWPCLYRASLRGSQRRRWCTAARHEFHHWNCPIWRSLFIVRWKTPDVFMYMYAVYIYHI